MKSQLFTRSNQGFTLIESLVVIMIIGILSAIAAPSWLKFINDRRLNIAQDQVYRAIRETQSNAKRDKVTWQASFQQITVNNKPVVRWAVHRANVTPPAQSWQNLEQNIRLDSETNLLESTIDSNTVRRVLFNYQGCPVFNVWDQCTQTGVQTLGRITLSTQNGGTAKRCVIVSTLLGALRTAKEKPEPQNGKYCH